MAETRGPQVSAERDGGAGAGSRRARREQQVAALRAQGRYGPELRDVLPAFALLGVAVVVLVLLLGVVRRTLGTPGLLGGILLLTAVGAVALRLGRAAARRRRGRYTARELARLDDRGLVEATARMLRRDGWSVADLTLRRGRTRLSARDGRGRSLDVSFRSDASEQDAGLAATKVQTSGWEDPGPSEAEPSCHVVVHRGEFTRAEVMRAARRGDTRLVDGRLLRLWAAGTPLDELPRGDR
ncbi:hypothetical protein MTQ10_12065 [Streptomyces sp. XM83C]|jgi:hypothetical protein|uniref:Restriction endonuclease type IV Mrr domain-containing protein n=1 Tax=Streptomyces thermocoprophilus TaxID=78356 RepID=A0ABV5VJN8_9ACTN|nr:hypothetical protein [Streptomyces sp. XM83C]MCK1820335.1 hypothetical protein [Streptomyces sp. XM83C]